MVHGRRWLGGSVFLLAVAALLVGCSTPHREDFIVPAPPTPLAARAPACQPMPTAGELTLQEAVDTALARNPDIATAEANIRASVATLMGARAEQRPHIGLDASVLGGDAPSMYLMKRIDARTLPPDTNFNDPGAFWNFELGATLRYNVWDGGVRRLGEYAAEAGVHAERSRLEAVQNVLAGGVVTTFLSAKAAEELLNADDASVRTVESQVAETRAKYEMGQTLKSDLLSLEVRLASAKERRIRTDIARRVALAGLKRLLAVPQEIEIRLGDATVEAAGLPENKDQALVEAFRHRAEVKAIRYRVRQAKIEVERARRSGAPKVDLQARWYGDDDGLELSSNWWVLVALSWDLYDGGRRESQLMYARAVLDRMKEEDRKALLDVALQVETSLLELEEARARQAVATQAVGAADETLELVEKQYQAGTATITRFLEAEEARTQARTRKIGAALDVNRAVVNVKQALGRLGRGQ